MRPPRTREPARPSNPHLYQTRSIGKGSRRRRAALFSRSTAARTQSRLELHDGRFLTFLDISGISGHGNARVRARESGVSGSPQDSAARARERERVTLSLSLSCAWGFAKRQALQRCDSCDRERHDGARRSIQRRGEHAERVERRRLSF